MKTCFAIMPFGKEFDDIHKILRVAVEDRCKLKYIRGDQEGRSGKVLPQILHEIHRADVVIADISGHNANVFYELAIAHHIKGPERVVIITQGIDGKKAFDIHQFRQYEYANNEQGRRRLLEDLPGRVREALDSSPHEEFWNVVRGRLPRTRMIVRDLQQLLERATPKELARTTIRVAAGLSSLAISDHEPVDSHAGEEYHEALLAERDALREVLVGGAKLKAVLNPPRAFSRGISPERLRARYQRMIGLLEGRSDILRRPKSAAADVAAMKQCAIALCPVPMPNLFIVGNSVAYEGVKRGGSGGFEMTHWVTSREGVDELISQFDRLFEDSTPLWTGARPAERSLVDQLRRFYEEAAAPHVRRLL